MRVCCVVVVEEWVCGWPCVLTVTLATHFPSNSGPAQQPSACWCLLQNPHLSNTAANGIRRLALQLHLLRDANEPASLAAAARTHPRRRFLSLSTRLQSSFTISLFFVPHHTNQSQQPTLQIFAD